MRKLLVGFKDDDEPKIGIAHLVFHGQEVWLDRPIEYRAEAGDPRHFVGAKPPKDREPCPGCKKKWEPVTWCGIRWAGKPWPLRQVRVRKTRGSGYAAHRILRWMPIHLEAIEKLPGCGCVIRLKAAYKAARMLLAAVPESIRMIRQA